MSKSCGSPSSLSIEHGYIPAGSTQAPGTSISVICHEGYEISGSPTMLCAKNGTWMGAPKCKLAFLDDVWFWLLLGLGLLATISLITALCLYCTKRHRYRRNRVRALDSNGEDYVGCCGGCCDYGGSCDVCGCIDYYGCCSLYGCYGYLGVCSFCFGCCRCCREPLESHRRRMEVTGNVFYINQHSVTPRVSTRWNELPKVGRMSKKDVRKMRKKRQRFFEAQNGISPRIENPLSDELYAKVRREAKPLALWSPHSNPVRNINTSTK